MKADKGRKFGKGGMSHEEKGEMKADIKQDKAIVKKAIGMHDKQLHGGKKTSLGGLKSGGRIASKGEHPVQKQSKRGAEVVKMAGGGLNPLAQAAIAQKAKQAAAGQALKQAAVGQALKQAAAAKALGAPVGMKSGGRTAAKGMHPVQKQSKRGAIDVKMCGGGMAKKTGRGR